MKAIKIFWLVILFQVLGCSSDDSIEPVFEDKLAGDWTITNVAMTGKFVMVSAPFDFIGWGYDEYPTSIQFEILSDIGAESYLINFNNTSKSVSSQGDLSFEYNMTIMMYGKEYHLNNRTMKIAFFNAGNWDLKYNNSVIEVHKEGEIVNYFIQEFNNDDELVVLKREKLSLEDFEIPGENILEANLNVLVTLTKNQ